MSTKIYTAYRTKPNTDLFALVRDLRAKGAASATWLHMAREQRAERTEQSA